jgi:hypothetical protein
LNTGWSFYELYELRLLDINVRLWKQLLQICHKTGLSVYTPLVSQWIVKCDSGVNDRYCIGLYSRCYAFIFSLNNISKGSFKGDLKCLPWRYSLYVPMKNHCICTRLHVVTSHNTVFFIGTIDRPSYLKSRCQSWHLSVKILLCNKLNWMNLCTHNYICNFGEVNVLVYYSFTVNTTLQGFTIGFIVTCFDSYESSSG